jgi:hypothetical protein
VTLSGSRFIWYLHFLQTCNPFRIKKAGLNLKGSHVYRKWLLMGYPTLKGSYVFLYLKCNDNNGSSPVTPLRALILLHLHFLQTCNPFRIKKAGLNLKGSHVYRRWLLMGYPTLKGSYVFLYLKCNDNNGSSPVTPLRALILLHLHFLQTCNPFRIKKAGLNLKGSHVYRKWLLMGYPTLKGSYVFLYLKCNDNNGSSPVTPLRALILLHLHFLQTCNPFRIKKAGLNLKGSHVYRRWLLMGYPTLKGSYVFLYLKCNDNNGSSPVTPLRALILLHLNFLQTCNPFRIKKAGLKPTPN